MSNFIDRMDVIDRRHRWAMRRLNNGRLYCWLVMYPVNTVVGCCLIERYGMGWQLWAGVAAASVAMLLPLWIYIRPAWKDEE